MDEDRLKLPKPQKYLHNKILVGNWFEDQCSYKKNIFRHDSEYTDEFKKKLYTTHPPSVVWDATIKAEGLSFYPEKASDEFPNYYDNFSTTYDLSYKHFPTMYGKPIYRMYRSRLQRYDPTDEYLRSYGNGTDFGLTSCKELEWGCDKQDPRTTSFTMYNIEFPCPEDESYKFTRWTRPTPVKGQYGKVHRPYPPDHPRFSKCNPITWECKSDLRQKCF